MRRFPTLALLFGLLPLTGCGRLERAARCRELAAVVNPRLDAIEQVARTESESPAKYGKLAEQYRELAAALAPFEERAPQLRPQLGGYRQTLERTADITGQLAPERTPRALRHQKQALRRELERLTERHRVGTKVLEGACLGE